MPEPLQVSVSVQKDPSLQGDPPTKLFSPQLFPVHVRLWHWFPFGHWVAVVQSTHVPEPLQKSPLPHAVLMALFGLLGVPDVQMSLVHELPSTNTSLSSTALVVPPTPLQRSSRQLPVTCIPAGSAVP